ncbi:MAG: Uma2 family endonuclease, partial [Pseudanabaena sp.]
MTMAIAKTTKNAKPRVTFADYLTYFDGSDTKYELVDGELVAMSLGTSLHGEAIDPTYQAINAEINRTTQPWIVRQGQIGVR